MITKKVLIKKLKKFLKNKRMVRITAGLALLSPLIGTSMAVAFGGIPPGGGTGNPPDDVVPEISALEGTAALAVVLAMLLLAWERRNRA